MSTVIRILLVDDHSQVHRALRVINDTYDDMQLVAHASNGIEAIQLCDEHQPDLILMDVIMPEMDGIEATRTIHERYPSIKILALSSFGDEDSVRAMMKVGAAGYVLKNSPLADLTHAIRAIYSGKTVFSAEVTQALLQPKVEAPEPQHDYGLSQREIEVLALIVKGHSNKQIAQLLTISEATAKFHVRGILAKLNVNGRVEAVALAIEKNLTG
jgi:two-component system, NarL family, response regulator LiaR